MRVPEGVNRWQTKQGLTVVRVHYTADPGKRDEKWQAEQRRGMSEAMWERADKVATYITNSVKNSPPGEPPNVPKNPASGC